MRRSGLCLYEARRIFNLAIPIVNLKSPMPIQVGAITHRLNESEFGRIAYDVMRCVFEIHNDLGRFFDEKIYKRELSLRYPTTRLEVPIEVKFDSFCKCYFLDALIGGCAPFELKTVESLTDRHRSQLLNYLLLADLPHGKLVNMRTEQVQHEFVNTMLRPQSRMEFVINDRGWQEIGDEQIKEWFIAFLHDVGTCLDIGLYEEALTYLLGSEERVIQDVNVISGGVVLGPQKFRLVGSDVAFRVTALSGDPRLFEIHARRLLDHTNLEAIQWINVTRTELSFQTIRKRQRKSDKKM
jgi:GxxExxY protein